MPIVNASHKATWNKTSQHVARQAHLGNTYTPEVFASYMVRTFLHHDLVASLKEPNERWLEPAVGAGAFYFAILDWVVEQGEDPWRFALRFDALDVDAQAIEVFRTKVRQWFDAHGCAEQDVALLPIYHGSLATFAAPDTGYRGIIANPPYLSPARWSKEPAERQRLLREWQAACPGVSDPRSDLYVYFFEWAHTHLMTGGVSVFLCSDTWLEREFGAHLRAQFRDAPELHLSQIAVWPWASVFRDDTCPVVTVVRRQAVNGGADAKKSPTQLQVFEGDPVTGTPVAYRDGTSPLHVQTVDLREWFSVGTVHRRGWLTNGPLMPAIRAAMTDYQPLAVPLLTWMRAESVSTTLNQLAGSPGFVAKPGGTGAKAQSAWAGKTEDWKDGTPIFYQAQARVGKPVDYAPSQTVQNLKCRMAQDAVAPYAALLRTGGIWMSGAIDRMPLPMYTKESVPVLGVSKYLHLAATDALNDSLRAQGLGSHSPEPLMAALLTCTPVLLSMEYQLQEGTRKTLRTNEQGYAKEITRGRLEDILLPNIRTWSAAAIQGVLDAQSNRASQSLSRMDDAMANPAWLAVDDAIREAMGVGVEEWNQWRAVVLACYWRRMRATLRYGTAQARLANSMPLSRSERP